MRIGKTTTYSIILVTMLMLTASLSGLAIADTKGTSTSSKEYTHTVLAEEGTATWCGYCPTVVAILDNIWESEEFDWNLVTLVDDMNPAYSGNRLNELGLTGFPTVFYDGLYGEVGGAGPSQSVHEAMIDECGARDVADIDINLEVLWLGDAEMNIEFDVINNEDSYYDGHVHVYITEDYSRWYAGTQQYRFAMIGNYAYNGDITVDASDSWHHSTTWDGDTYGFGDITSDNIRVIVAVFDQSTMMVDETLGRYPITNLDPTADFSFTPEDPEATETITFTDESVDSDGSISSWNWDFGDGETSTNQNPTHAYTESGYYTVTLTVEDDDAAINTYSEMIVVTEPGESATVIQTIFDRGFPIRHAADGDWAGAQNFTSTINTLTKADLYLRKFGTPEFDLTVELRENDPEGTLLESLTFTPSEIPSSWEWFSVDFNDTTVTPGSDYFIVIPPAPSGVTSSFGYEWAYAFGNQYDDGSFWFTRDGGGLWRDLPDSYEFTISVYGLL